MMKADRLIKELKKYDLGPYIEVPCSILSPLISSLSDDRSIDLMNPVNEAVAAGIASGSYLHGGKISVVMMQNSGLCNVMNSLTSLNQIYSIPILFIISWRGEPGRIDAPEHNVMGVRTKELLDLLGIPFRVMSENSFVSDIKYIVSSMRKTDRPGALLLREGVLDPCHGVTPPSHRSGSGITRSDAIEIITGACGKDVYMVTTNGFISRDAFYAIEKSGLKHNNPAFYMLGSMGHALAIGLGLAKQLKGNRKAIVIDGDGGCLMHLGAMASVGKESPERLIHVVLDNGCYASTGGQKTVSESVDLCGIAEGCGYKRISRFADRNSMEKAIPAIMRAKGPSFVQVRIEESATSPRPRISDKYSCVDIKEIFMKRIKGGRR